MKDIKELEKAEIEAIDPAEFGINDAKELKRLLTRFMKEYAKKPAELSDQEWLKGRFLAELPDMSEEEAEQLSRDTVSSIQEYNNNLASLHEARAQGKTSDEWFAEKAQEASVGVATLGFAEKLGTLDTVLSEANCAMYDTIVTKAGDISRNSALYGQMAEQYHANTFNAAAVASDSPYRAVTYKPPYKKDSFDITIKDANGKIVHQYQSKFGLTAENTIARIKEGNYNNQILLVPEDQVEAVRAAFPGKTVVSQIGGTDKVPVTSKSMTLADAQKLQEEAHNVADWPKLDWKTYDTKKLAKFVGKKAAVAGVQAAALATGFHLAAKLIKDEPVDGEEVVKVALQTGADVGVKSSVAGALIIAERRGITSIRPWWLPKWPVCDYTAIACVAVENVKILWRVAKGEITMREALDLMGCNTVAMSYGLAWGATGSGIGILALSWIPVVGPLVGGVVGGLVGYMAGSKVGEVVYGAAKSIVSTAKKVVKGIFEGGKKLLEKAGNFLSNLFA